MFSLEMRTALSIYGLRRCYVDYAVVIGTTLSLYGLHRCYTDYAVIIWTKRSLYGLRRRYTDFAVPLYFAVTKVFPILASWCKFIFRLAYNHPFHPIDSYRFMKDAWVEPGKNFAKFEYLLLV